MGATPVSVSVSAVTVTRTSYLFVLVALALTGWLHLGALLIAALFSIFALSKLNILTRGHKWAAVALLVVIIAAVAYGLAFFVHATVEQFPSIVDKSIPAIINWARQHQIEAPFTDYDSLKDLVMTTAKSQVRYLGDFARFAGDAARETVLLSVGCIVAAGIFLGKRARNLDANDLCSAGVRLIEARFETFYTSFAIVMGGQLSIALVNTVLTAVFVVATGLPHVVVILGATLLCGMLPVVGNLISNTLMVCIAFTVSPQKALTAVIFLVVVHKLEYFLNSKIIGRRIRSPIWLTLVALVAGERLMGIPGMILSPVILQYIRMEAATIAVE